MSIADTMRALEESEKRQEKIAELRERIYARQTDDAGREKITALFNRLAENAVVPEEHLDLIEQSKADEGQPRAIRAFNLRQRLEGSPYRLRDNSSGPA